MSRFLSLKDDLSDGFCEGGKVEKEECKYALSYLS